MKRQESKAQPAKPAVQARDKKMPGDGEVFDPPENEDEDDADAPDELEEETGLDLTDASDLDADNVLADEEFDRVMQAPD
jgi:hypothetical protein